MRGDPIPKIPLEEKAVQEASTHASVQQYIKTAKNFKKRGIFFLFFGGKNTTYAWQQRIIIVSGGSRIHGQGGLTSFFLL